MLATFLVSRSNWKAYSN